MLLKNEVKRKKRYTANYMQHPKEALLFGQPRLDAVFYCNCKGKE